MQRIKSWKHLHKVERHLITIENEVVRFVIVSSGHNGPSVPMMSRGGEYKLNGNKETARSVVFKMRV
jgi:hypothetical protein